MNFIKRLLEKWACLHDWQELECVSVLNEFSGNIPAYHIHLYKCKKCGKFKKVKI